MKHIWQFIRPYRGLTALALLFVTLDVLGALIIPTITADMINVGVGSGNLNYIIEKGVLMLIVTVLSGASALLGSYMSAKLSAQIGRDMRNALYEKSLDFSIHDFEQYGTGSMITRILSDVSIIQQAVVWCVTMVLPVPALSLMGIVMAFSIDPSMGMILGGGVVFVVLLTVVISKKAASVFGRLQRFLDRMNVVMRENITGVRVIRAFNKEAYETKRMKKSFEDYAKAAVETNLLFAGLDSFSFFSISILVVAILWFGGNRIGAGTMEIGDITALTEYTILILFYLMMAQMVIILLPRARVCLERIGEVLDREPEIRDGAGEEDLEKQKTEREISEEKDLTEAASFEGVSFRFADADEDTLGNLTFACRRGETTAVIGGTGSGKSTIAKLMMRFYDASGGTVRICGRDVKKMRQEDLRKHVSYVPQKAWLFSGTIADNLKYGNPDASEEEMFHALSVAQADFVTALPEGLSSHTAQGGTNFSGGQKQRLSIARALMKKADLYIFDDSFSALDFKTDSALRKALKEETKEAAVLIIAQRINTILNADQIIVLNEGKIAGIGTHRELMERCSVYQEIAKSQMKGGEE
ncbi:MAG: ABC transporter ATP-binding protein [Clostridium sp.]|nr:ABC transporter ATP-binding protein [Clostridium sp.]